MASRRRRSLGQSLVEFSLVLPIFLVMMMAVIDVGRAVWAQNSLAAAAREGARYAIVHGGSGSTTCPVGPPVSGITVVPAASASCPYPSPSTQSIKNAVIAAAQAGGSSLAVTVCYGAGCTGDTNAAGATNARGTPVTVSVTSRINLITPSLLGMSGFGVSSMSTMVVNH